MIQFNMIKIRIHGRGGQGVVTAAEIIALSAFLDKWQAQAFPAFGVERTGAPIQSFVRLDKQEILSKAQISEPDIIVILDPTLLNEKNTLSGAKKETIIIINSNKKIDISNFKKVYWAPASEIALKIIGKNIVNTVTLGIFAQATKLISLKSLLKAIEIKFKDKDKEIIKLNQTAIKLAYQYEGK
jgi:pyruvate ferredoxin oxidoreductase gamma subunit